MIPTYRRLSDRHPYEIYLLVWVLVATLPAALGLTEVPGTIAHMLDPWAARVWAVGLTMGALIALIGLGWRRPPFPKLSVTGLVLEQVGLVTLGATTLFYTFAAAINVGTGALPVLGVVLGVGTASFAQAAKIQRVLNLAERRRH